MDDIEEANERRFVVTVRIAWMQSLGAPLKFA